MPIIEMKKVFLLGHRGERENIFNLLHDFGSVQLVDITDSNAWAEFEGLLEPDRPDDKAAILEEDLGEVRYCLDFLQRHFPIRKSFVQQFTGSKLELSGDQFAGYIERSAQVKEVYETCRSAEEDLARLRNEETRYQNMIAELNSWKELDLPLEYIGSGPFARYFLGAVANDHFEDLNEHLEKSGFHYHLEKVSADNEQVYFFMAGLLAEHEELSELFKDNAVTSIEFPNLTGTASENILLANQRLEELEAERTALLADIEAMLEQRTLLMSCFDYLDNEYKKQDAIHKLARTENSFLLEGWVPEPVAADLEQQLTAKTETAVLAVRNPLPGEAVPVLLHNQGPAEAYEVVTKLYSTPRKSELDPTPYLAPFFFIFFGICLSDAGYGLVLAAISLVVMRKLKLGGMGKQLLNLLFYGGISSVVFGILLGSYFGDLIKLPALWFDPLEDPMRMLFYCFGIGLVHIYFGMALQAYRNIKAGHPLSALFDQGMWFIFLNGLIMLLLPELAVIGKWLALAGGAGLILTQGRSQQGVVKKLLSGMVSLYNITGYLSDILSYSRLLALGLATGVIASAINSMGGMIAGTVVGSIIMVVVLFGGHLFNIVISTLGSYVHTSRLQYIEFFGKFFEGGGSAFQPFAKQTSYIDIVDKAE